MQVYKSSPAFPNDHSAVNLLHFHHKGLSAIVNGLARSASSDGIVLQIVFGPDRFGRG
jgi:hypothetical protein